MKMRDKINDLLRLIGTAALGAFVAWLVTPARSDEMPIQCDQGGGLAARCWIPSVLVPAPEPPSVGGPGTEAYRKDLQDPAPWTGYFGNEDTKWVGKICKLNDPHDCWKCAPEEALACRAHVAAGEIYCAVEDDIIDGKCVAAKKPVPINLRGDFDGAGVIIESEERTKVPAKKPVGTERKPGDMTVDSHANPQGDPALYYWPECQVPDGQSPACLDKKKAGCVLNGLDWDSDHKLCRAAPAGGSGAPDLAGAEKLYSAGPYHHPGDMNVGTGLCYVVDKSNQWIPCERFLQGIFGSWSSPRCPPDYAILEVPGTTFLVCARDLQAPKSW